MSQALIFQSTTFDVVDRSGQPWIQSRQLASALGYKDENSVRKIYERNVDEFTDAMTATVKMTVGITPVDVRIFSLRGCHLLAMFARTPVAKAFRVWVLDILDKLNAERAKAEPVGKTDNMPDGFITPDQQCTLQAMVRALVEKGGIYANIWSRFNNHFRIARYAQLPQSRLSEAIDYRMRFEVAPRTLPGSPLPAPKQDNVPAVREKTYREQCAEVTARVLALRNELFRVSDDMTEAFRRPFWGTGIPEDKKPFADAMNYAVQSLYMAVNKDLEAIQQLFTAYVEGEAMMNR